MSNASRLKVRIKVVEMVSRVGEKNVDGRLRLREGVLASYVGSIKG